MLHPLETPIVTPLKGNIMKTGRINKGVGQEYIVMYKVYVQADGSMVVVIGNQRLEVSGDEVHALLCGSLEYAKVFAALHTSIDQTALAILKDSHNGQAGG